MNNKIVFSLILFTLTSGVVLSSSYTSAGGSVLGSSSVISPTICTMSATGMDSHNATVELGSYTQDIGMTTATVKCNDAEGFSIYASGFTGDEAGKPNSNKLIGASHKAVISTGTATSGTTIELGELDKKFE